MSRQMFLLFVSGQCMSVMLELSNSESWDGMQTAGESSLFNKVSQWLWFMSAAFPETLKPVVEACSLQNMQLKTKFQNQTTIHFKHKMI